MVDGLNKKRILIFSTAYAPFVGGAEIAVKEITDRVSDCKFVMVTARMRKDLKPVETIGNIEVHRIGRGDRWDKIRLVFLGSKKAKELGQFGLVWSIMASYAGFAALAFKKRNASIPFLLTLQEGDSKAHIYSRVWFVWPLFKQIFKRADHIQAISHYLADWAKEMRAECPVEVVPNGVHMEHGTWNMGQNRKTLKKIVTVSRLVEKNGVEDLIRAMQELGRDDVVLDIVGDGVLRKKLKGLVRELGLEKNVTFVGKVSYKEIYNRLDQVDVFVRPSLSEGLGNAFLEAMATGVPVIGTRVGGIPDFLKDGETGWFCEVKNPKSIAEKISYVLDEKNKEHVEQVVRRAKQMVEEKYNWDLIARKMERIFQSL